MKDLAFGGIKVHILHFFPFFKAEKVILEDLAFNV